MSKPTKVITIEAMMVDASTTRPGGDRISTHGAISASPPVAKPKPPTPKP